ncbi:MAG TPA: M24 family metallopeptidase [Acidobacteriota bacterium]|nr:M24 family metallopeptidase [Acidobacteriota bacterium]
MSRIVCQPGLMIRRNWIALLLLAVGGGLLCAVTPETAANPWPAIRRARVERLLPAAMQAAGADAWVVICRENANDPLALHVGGENAGGQAAFLFFLKDGRVASLAITPPGEATALQEVGLHDAYRVLARDESLWSAVAAALHERGATVVAVNSSARAVADGFSHTQRRELEAALGAGWPGRLVSSEELVLTWLAVKLPEEIAIMRDAARLTERLLLEAYAIVAPGQTTDADVARSLKGRMRELGVGDAWAPDQNPNVNSGPDRGHSHSTGKIIMPGDVIQIDFGILVHGVWCSDLQRFAYVLREGEAAPPPEIRRYWERAVQGHRRVLAALKPDVRGFEVDRVQREWMAGGGSLPVPWGTGHPVGYWAHDAGPMLTGGQPDRTPAGDALRVIAPGMVFAYDGYFCWPVEYQGRPATKTISVEEMAVVTATGAEYLIPPQAALILIPPRR